MTWRIPPPAPFILCRPSFVTYTYLDSALVSPYAQAQPSFCGGLASTTTASRLRKQLTLPNQSPLDSASAPAG